MREDWLEVEGLMIARLKDQVPSVYGAVYGAASLSRLDEISQATPAIHVLYDGEIVGASRAGAGAAQMITQRWLAVVAVKSAIDQISGIGARASAGVLLSSVISALAGHQLSPDFRPLARAQAERPGYAGEFAYFPTAWEVTFVAA